MNQNFIDISSRISELGVHNNSFMLRLDNEDLRDVDPLADNLNHDTCYAIVEECMGNPWYFIREILRPDNVTDMEMRILYLSFNRLGSWNMLPSRHLANRANIFFSVYQLLFGEFQSISVNAGVVNRSKRFLRSVGKLSSCLHNVTGVSKIIMPNDTSVINPINNTRVIVSRGNVDNLGKQHGAYIYDNAEYIHDLPAILDSTSVMLRLPMKKDLGSFIIVQSEQNTDNRKLNTYLGELLSGSMWWNDSFYDGRPDAMNYLVGIGNLPVFLLGDENQRCVFNNRHDNGDKLSHANNLPDKFIIRSTT